MLKAGNGTFEQFPVSTDRVEAYGVKCGNKYSIYLLNNASERIVRPVTFNFEGGKAVAIRSFDPGSRKYKPLTGFTLANGKLTPKNIGLEGKKR